jgi:adenine phosphoribosyltransferase
MCRIFEARHRVHDITPVLANPVAFKAVTDQLAEHVRMKCDAVLAIESRSFIISAPLAQRRAAVHSCNAASCRARRSPFATRLEYGFDHLEMHSDAIRRGGCYLIVDDVIATGHRSRRRERRRAARRQRRGVPVPHRAEVSPDARSSAICRSSV